tara:strand:- start:9006 stop:9242 length:237 start_codon:yes stop_codon:yes gene_type:complete
MKDRIEKVPLTYVKITKETGLATNVLESLSKGKLILEKQTEINGLLYGFIRNEVRIVCRIPAENYEIIKNKQTKKSKK